MEIGDFVKVAGLQNDKAKQYNEKTGTIISLQEDVSGRYGVSMHGMNKGLAIKPSNLTSINLEEALQLILENEGQDMNVKVREQFKKEVRLLLLIEKLMFRYKDTEFLFNVDEHERFSNGDEYVDFTPVSFHRPDGDVEGKDVQWCLDNDFYQIEDGYWSGDWYFRDRPNLDKQVYIEETLKIREINQKRRDFIDAKSAAEADERIFEEKHREEELNKVLMSDIARMRGRDIDDTDFFTAPISGTRPSDEEISELKRLAKSMK